MRHTGSWPLIAVEKNADFKLVQVCGPSNGMLTLRMEVYDPLYGTVVRTRGLNGTWSRPLRLIDSMLDWPLAVEDLFEASSVQIAHGDHILPEDIFAWLLARCLFDSLVPSRSQPSKDDLAHMLWAIVRSQLVTEDGPESFDRLPSLEDWTKQIRNGKLDLKWIRHLNKALSKRTIYITQLFANGERYLPIRFFGFGPRGLDSSDTIFFPSGESRSATALFLRSAGSGYKAIGGGLAWMWPNKFPDECFVPSEIEVRLI
jgi:hypothetical protein